ncbi:MAG: CpsB/CapC family capsule biosynthesis tyrosine phosphatase [Ferruginibacter sp.]
MFSFFKNKKPAESSGKYFPFKTDMHSHILPGIDDGSPDVATSIKLIKGLMEMGVTQSIATPHIIGDLYRNNPETINTALKILQDELKKQKITFKVSAAAEYMLDSYFYEILNSKEKLQTLKDNIILTEFSYASMPEDPGKMSFAIIMEGYVPILAHPERYPYYYGNYKMFHHLADLGYKLQVNLLSLTGYYGKEALKVASYLLKNDLVSYVGTDMHHERHLGMLSDPKIRATFNKFLSHKTWNEF